MIAGTVNPFREAMVALTVRGPLGQEETFEALVDTGFTGYLTLPPQLVTALALLFRRSGRGQLADGTEVVFDVFEARVIWDGQERRVPVDAVDAEPLIGMGLLNGYRLTVECVDGGLVSIGPLATP